MVAFIDAEVRDASQQNAVFAAVGFHVVGAVVLDERADNLLALYRADLLVDKAAVIRDGQLEDIALDQL